MSEKNNQFTSVVKKFFSLLIKFIRSFVRFIFKNKVGQVFTVIAILVISGFLLYAAGERAGIKKQKAEEKNRISSNNSGTLPQGLSSTVNLKRKSIIGNVLNVSAKSIEVKQKNGEPIKAKINDDTDIYGLDRKKSDYKEIKKDQLVYITANINDDKSMTATRIRIQK